MTRITAPGFYPDMSAADYHAGLMPAGYDAWKTRSPDDDREEDRLDEELDDESLLGSLEDRDMVLPGWHAWGPYVVEVMESAEIGDWSTIVLPSRVGWKPTF